VPVDDESPTVTLSTEVPAALFEELHALVVNGWSRDLDDLVLDALRRYAESHRESLMEELVREDIDWACTEVTEGQAEVVCDADPLIHLDGLGCLDLLCDFPLVLVPEDALGVRRALRASPCVTLQPLRRTGA
jgi:hypothetical protein